MTAHAGGVGALEYPAGMAAVAADVLVGAVEIEAGAVMIKRLLCRCRGTQQQGGQYQFGSDIHRIF